jgi:phage major head subunit gpT-like protein
MAHDTARGVATLRGLTAKFDNGVKSITPFYPELAMTMPSKGLDEQYSFLGRVPQMREWLGDRDFKGLLATQWTLVNKLWEQSLEIEKTDIDDDRLGLYGVPLAQMGVRAGGHPDKEIFTLIENAETGICFDGQCFFDTDHSFGDSGSQDNDLTYVAATGTTPTVAEFKLAYNAAVLAIMSFVDDKTELMNAHIFNEAQQIIIVCNPALRQIVHDALSVRTVTTGGENFVMNQPRIYTSALYTSAAKFDIYKVDEPMKPFIFQTREPLSRQMKGENDLETKAVKFMTQARYVMGYGAWWTGVRTTFT